MAKDVGVKPRPPAKKKQGKDEKQSERFIETAQTIGVDESGEKFEDAFSKIVRKTTEGPV